jgi:hypothetical protein
MRPKKPYMYCDLCKRVLHPLNAHFGRLKKGEELITAHIKCWNKAIEGKGVNK